MANKWRIPIEVENFVISRDKTCVYCGVTFTNDNNSRKTKKSCEHIVTDIRLNGVDNIALCCMSCNSSKGSKLLKHWLESKYCKDKGITKETVALVVIEAIESLPKVK